MDGEFLSTYQFVAEEFIFRSFSALDGKSYSTNPDEELFVGESDPTFLMDGKFFAL